MCNKMREYGSGERIGFTVRSAVMALNSGRFRDNAQLQAAARNSPPLAIGAKGDHVQILQRALGDLGFAMPISAPQRAPLPDGIYGQETAGTVRKFQIRERLAVDGIAGTQTLTRLDQIFVANAAREELVLRSQLARLFWT
jgi:peptidoglycan hydrolase-like protein with peptidoglycan-binding domain